MKQKIILLALIALSFNTYSQTKNAIYLMYGVAANDVNINGAIGDFGYQTQNAFSFGLGYTRGINTYFSVETGLNFSSNKTKENSSLPERSNTYYNSVKLITVPLLARFGFFKYLYADIGLSVDVQTNYNNSIGQPPNQSGLGVEGGLGGKYDMGRFSIFVYPYLKNFGVIKFTKHSDFNLLGGGVKFGAGYNF